ncbi:hypothetical protein AB0M02_18295 [Actinoplanes sp. NPDC051861]|uniref:hypothetical protein n=1 Tax=Actinoplanes sp. NPDC051861 TaxID=3155170 RepID=UPI003440EE81
MSTDFSPVPELNQLKEFQDRTGYEQYADGFGLDAWNDTSGLEAGWSKDPEFLSRLLPFARATGGGSFYALWRVDDRDDLSTLPVAAFGDEGGEYVVARDVRELFQLLAFDSEISVSWDSVYFYRDEEDEHSAYHDEFVAWLDEQFGLAPADDPDAVLEAARDEFGERFETFKNAFLNA